MNTPLTHAPIAAGLSRLTVPDISEDDEPAKDETDDPAQITGVQATILGLILSSGYIESLPIDVKKSVEALKGVQVKQNELQDQYKRECLELEKKYLGLQQPLYERRNAIISGAAQATAEEIEAGSQASLKDDPLYPPLPNDEGAPAAIPEFWSTALRNHVGLSKIITERDAGALKNLTDIRLSYLPSDSPKPGFKISFIFNPNDYFENDVLDKTYLYQEEFVYDHAIGTEIKWKEDKDLTKEFEIKKQQNENTNRTRLGEDMDDEDLVELEEKLEMDYQIGEEIILRAIDYFTGKALEDDFDELDDEDEDGQFDDEDSDSEVDSLPRRRGPLKGRGGSSAGAVNLEECKQQPWANMHPISTI
ncbi:NAP-domain-containing protein [Suillus variegatus]|nr:NAP-domain-containing protein [Suillus variegatus]